MKENVSAVNLPAYRKILVPVDFTDYSMNAGMFAVGLAGRWKAEIELVHAYYSPELTSMTFDESFSFHGTLTDFIQENRDKAMNDLEEFSNRIREFIAQHQIRGVRVGTSLLRGLPSEATLYMADTYRPDVIIMGTQSIDKRKESSGSVVRIIRDARVPVLVIPENYRYGEANTMTNVAYATDYDESDFVAIKKLMGLIAAFSLKVICIHVGQYPVKKEETDKMDGMKEYFKRNYPDFEVECVLAEHGEIVEGLDKVVKEMEIDILALTTHRRSLINSIIHPSLTKKMYFHTNIPLLVFHS